MMLTTGCESTQDVMEDNMVSKILYAIKDLFASVSEAIIAARQAEADAVVRRFKGQ